MYDDSKGLEDKCNSCFSRRKYSKEQIKNIQKIFNASSGVFVGEDGIIGKKTATQIENYAKKHNWGIDCACDRLSELGVVMGKVEEFNHNGDQIEQIQSALNETGYTDDYGKELVVEPYIGECALSAIDKYAKDNSYTMDEAINLLIGNDIDTDAKYPAGIEESISSFKEIWNYAEAAYELGIITEQEKEIVQNAMHEEANGIRKTATKAIKEDKLEENLGKLVEFALFDLVLGDVDGGTVYAPSEADIVRHKIIDDENNFKKVLSYTFDVIDKLDNKHGRKLLKTFIDEKPWQVDIEYDKGIKQGSMYIKDHMGNKFVINSVDDLAK